MASFLSTQPYKGTRDFFPPDMRFQRWLFDRLRASVGSFGFEEYDGPMLEPFELYAAKTGEEIVNQQLYWMMDRGDRKLAVRPEMTPTMARMVASKVNELPKPVRWFSIPNVWRYERPQRGRLREHWQLNVDILGGDRLLADAECLGVALDIMKRLGGAEHVSLKVNNRRLVDHLFTKELALSAETALAATKAIDVRAKVGDEVYAKMLTDIGISPAQRERLERFFKSTFAEVERDLPCEGVEELKALFALMKESGAADQVVFDPTVLRGLDYYTGTVFEAYDVSPENRRALFGGGRYDDLLGLFGKTKLSGVGFGVGDVGLRNFCEVHGLMPELAAGVDVFVSLPKAEYRAQAERVASGLRAQGLSVVTPLAVEGFGSQLKQATKLGARYAVLFGDTELAEGKVLLKNLVKGEQKTVTLDELLGAHAVPAPIQRNLPAWW